MCPIRKRVFGTLKYNVICGLFLGTTLAGCLEPDPIYTCWNGIVQIQYEGGSRLSLDPFYLWRDIPAGLVLTSGMNSRRLVLLFPTPSSTWSPPSVQHCCRWSSSCAAETNEWLDFSCSCFSSGVLVSAKWSKCPGSKALHARGCVAALRKNSAGWMPARTGRLFDGVGRSTQSQIAVRRWLSQWGGFVHCDTKSEYNTLCL